MSSHCRDWGSSMLPASYKGVHFYVDQDEIIGGRRVSVHEFTNRDTPFNEDLGGRAQPVTVNAYLEGDDAPAKASALFAICNTKGAGPLVLPNGGVHSVHCLDVRLRNDYRRLGLVKVTMSFIKDFGLVGGLQARVNPIRQVQVLAARARSVISDAFSARYSTQDRIFGRATDIAMTRVADEIRLVSGLALVSLDGVSVDQQKFADIHRSVTDFAEDAVRYSRQISNFSDLARVSSDKDVVPVYSEAGRVTADLMGSLVTATTDPRALFLSLSETILGANDPDELAGDLDHVSITRRSSAKLLGDYRTVARQAMGIAIMESAGAAAQFIKSRRDARFIRARMGDVTDEIIAESKTQEEIAILSELRGEAAKALKEAPVLDVQSFVNGRGYDENNIGNASEIVLEANRQLPATYWAWRIYADPGRALELIERNDVAHPSFMPYEFEALSK